LIGEENDYNEDFDHTTPNLKVTTTTLFTSIVETLRITIGLQKCTNYK